MLVPVIFAPSAAGAATSVSAAIVTGMIIRLKDMDCLLFHCGRRRAHPLVPSRPASSPRVAKDLRRLGIRSDCYLTIVRPASCSVKQCCERAPTILALVGEASQQRAN